MIIHQHLPPSITIIQILILGILINTNLKTIIISNYLEFVYHLRNDD